MNLRTAVNKIRQWRRPDLKRVFFMHVPKCGGSSVHAALGAVYQRAGYQACHLNPHAAERAARVVGEEPHDYRRRLLLYAMAQEQTRYVSGHFPYSDQAWTAFGDQWHYVTILREPVSHWISWYLYNKHKTGSDHYRITAPIEEFVETDRSHAHGRSYLSFLTDGQQNADAALANLERFAVVGVLERLDRFTADCGALLGANLRVGHHRRSPKQARSEKISDATKERIREICAPNIEVYNRVLARIN